MTERVEKIEIIAESHYRDDEYEGSTLWVSHDGGKDREIVWPKFETVQELMQLSVGEILADYIENNLT